MIIRSDVPLAERSLPHLLLMIVSAAARSARPALPCPALVKLLIAERKAVRAGRT